MMAVLVLSGCDDSKPTDGLHKISFATHQSRTIVEDNEDLQQYNLRLFGTYTLDGRTARVFDSERLYYDNSLPGWSYDNTKYWVINAMYRFYAVCPYDAPATLSDEENKVMVGTYKGCTGGADLLYASAERNLEGNSDYSTVPLHFRHACAAVRFNLTNASSQVLKEVRNIRLVGLYNLGKFTFDSTGAVAWELNSTLVEDDEYDKPYGGICTLPEGGLPVNLDIKHPLYDERVLMVLPQSVYKTPITLHLEYIKEGDAEYAVRSIELGWLGGTTPTEWKSGEMYDYNLTITDNTITAEVVVVDWVDNFVDL